MGFLFVNVLSAQSFKQSTNSEVIGERIFMIDGTPSFPRNYSGAAILDFTGDNLKDFIIPSYYGPTNNYDVSYLRFFKNQGNGSFTEVTKKYMNPDISSGLYFIGSNDGRSIVFDFNKDGKMDFAFPSLWENNIYENYDKTYGFKKNRDYYFKNDPKNLASISYLGFHSPGFFYQFLLQPQSTFLI